MDPRWEDFAVFLADMGERPDGTTIDRRDNTKGYWRDNCRWASKTVQTRNRKIAVAVEVNGVDISVTDWAAQQGISYFVAYARLRKAGKLKGGRHNASE